MIDLFVFTENKAKCEVRRQIYSIKRAFKQFNKARDKLSRQRGLKEHEGTDKRENK